MLPQIGHMQRLDKFITPTKYFHIVHAYSSHAKESELYAWKKSIESQSEEITKQIKKTPRHSNVESCTFPVVPSLSVDYCMKDKDNDKIDVVEPKVSEFFFFFFPQLQCINYVRTMIELLFDIVFYRSLIIWRTQLTKGNLRLKKIEKKERTDEKDESKPKKKKKCNKKHYYHAKKKNPILNIDLPMDNANDSGKPKPSNSRKQLF